jgi:hypothetical protein
MIVSDEISSKIFKLMIENNNSDYFSIFFEKITEEINNIDDVEEVLCFSLDYHNDFDVIHIYPFIVSKLIDSEIDQNSKEDCLKDTPSKKIKIE